MLNLIKNQIRRILYDHGQNDKNLLPKQLELIQSTENLTDATNKFIRAIDNLHGEFLKEKLH